MNRRTLAQIAYEAYAKHQAWKNYQGFALPSWDKVRLDIQCAWEEAINTVISTLRTQEGHNT